MERTNVIALARDESNASLSTVMSLSPTQSKLAAHPYLRLSKRPSSAMSVTARLDNMDTTMSPGASATQPLSSKSTSSLRGFARVSKAARSRRGNGGSSADVVTPILAAMDALHASIGLLRHTEQGSQLEEAAPSACYDTFTFVPTTAMREGRCSRCHANFELASQKPPDRLQACKGCGAMFATMDFVSDERSKACPREEDPTVRGDSEFSRLQTVRTKAKALTQVIEMKMRQQSSTTRSTSGKQGVPRSTFARVERETMLRLSSELLGGNSVSSLLQRNAKVYQKIMSIVHSVELPPLVCDEICDEAVSIANEVFKRFGTHCKFCRSSGSGDEAGPGPDCKHNILSVAAHPLAVACLLETCHARRKSGDTVCGVHIDVIVQRFHAVADGSTTATRTNSRDLPHRVQAAVAHVEWLLHSSPSERRKGCIDASQLSSDDAAKRAISMMRAELLSNSVHDVHTNRRTMQRAFEWLDSAEAVTIMRSLPMELLSGFYSSSDGCGVASRALCKAFSKGAAPASVGHDQMRALLCSAPGGL